MQVPRKALPDRHLARLIYRSRSLLSDGVQETQPGITEILRVARRNNTTIGLTGVLLFDGARFLQAIEGDMDDVETAYESIACDRRHEAIELIEFKPIARRDYKTVPMAYIDGPGADRESLDALLRSLDAARVCAPGPAAPRVI